MLGNFSLFLFSLCKCYIKEPKQWYLESLSSLFTCVCLVWEWCFSSYTFFFWKHQLCPHFLLLWQKNNFQSCWLLLNLFLQSWFLFNSYVSPGILCYICIIHIIILLYPKPGLCIAYFGYLQLHIKLFEP